MKSRSNHICNCLSHSPISADYFVGISMATSLLTMSIAVANIIATPFLTVNTDIASVQASTFKEKKIRNTKFKQASRYSKSDKLDDSQSYQDKRSRS